MTEQSPQTAEIQKYYKLLTTLIITGFYLTSCTTDQDSPNSPDAVLTNNSPTTEVFDTADIVPTENPPAVETISFDEQMTMIMDQIGPVAAGEEMTLSRSSSAEMTAAIKTINEVSGDKVNAALEFQKPDGTSIFMGFFQGIDVEGSGGAIEPMSFYLLENDEVSQLSSALLTAEGAPHMVVGHFDFEGSVVDMTSLVEDISPEAVETAVAKIAEGTKSPSLVFIFSPDGGEVEAVYVLDSISGKYYSLDMSGPSAEVFANLSLLPISHLDGDPEGMWVLPLSMEAQLEGINWDYRWTELGLEIFDEADGRVLITRSEASGDWVQAPEIMMPMVPWEELIPANFPNSNRESLLSTFNGQFGYENGLNNIDGRYYLWCIATEDMVQHNPPIELTGGDIVTHSISCQYPGPDGKDHLVLIPALRFNEKERIYQILGFNPVVDNGFDSMLEMSTTGLGKDIGPLRFLESPFGYAGQGSILLVSFKMPDADYTQMPDEDYTQGFLPDSQRELYTPELLAEFARTGNPDLLPHQFLLPESEPFGNRLQAAMNDANN